MMITDINTTNTRTAWIAGASLDGAEFYNQIVYSLQRKQKLWNEWSKTPGCDYYFIEIELPHYPKGVIPPVYFVCDKCTRLSSSKAGTKKGDKCDNICFDCDGTMIYKQ